MTKAQLGKLDANGANRYFWAETRNGSSITVHARDEADARSRVAGIILHYDMGGIRAIAPIAPPPTHDVKRISIPARERAETPKRFDDSVFD